jgi:DNA gyrase subunit B
MSSKKYTEDSIKVHLADVDKVRARPTMYLGSNPMQHGLKEGVDNAIDEFGETKQGSKKWNIYIKYTKDKTKKEHTFTVADRGRGIPVGIHKKAKISTLTAVLTMIQAGGKFDDNSYTAGRGTHGTGIAATNAISSVFEVWTYREQWYYQKFQKGKPVTEVIKKKPDAEFAKNNCGTIIRFTFDNTIEQVKLDSINLDDIKNWLNITSMIDSPVKIHFEYETKKGLKTVEYFKPDGALDYLKTKIEENKLEVLGKKPFQIKSKYGSVIAQWSSTDEALFEGFTNGVHNPEGGTHISSFYKTLVKAFNSLVSNKKKQMKESDLKAGLIGFVNVKIAEAQYKGQTKDELKSPIPKEFEVELEAALKTWLSKNKSMIKELIVRALAIRQAKEQSKKIMKAASAIKDNARGAVLPGILTTCDSKCPASDREIFFVEGDSAAGTSRAARDKYYQMIFKMKGKAIPNIAKKSKASALSSKVIQTVLSGIGVDPKSFKTGVTPNFSVGRVIALVDPDPDGYHILNLWLTSLYMLVPQVFELDMVYIVDSPLFVASSKNKKIFGYTLKEIQKKAPKGAVITRLKGWAEAEPDELEEIAFNKETRKLLKVRPVSTKDGVKFLDIVGNDVTTRKQILGVAE